MGKFVFKCDNESHARFIQVKVEQHDGKVRDDEIARVIYHYVCGGDEKYDVVYVNFSGSRVGIVFVDGKPLYNVTITKGVAIVYVDGLGHYTARVRILRVPWDDPRLVMARAVVDKVLSEAGKYVANAIRGSGVKLTIRRVRRILSELGFTREPTKYTYLLIALLLMSAGYRVSLIGNNRRTKAIVALA